MREDEIKNKTPASSELVLLTCRSGTLLGSELAALMQGPSNNTVWISVIKYSSFYCLANILHTALLIRGGGGAVAWQVMADQRGEIKKTDVWILSLVRGSVFPVEYNSFWVSYQSWLYFNLIIVNYSHFASHVMSAYWSNHYAVIPRCQNSLWIQQKEQWAAVNIYTFNLGCNILHHICVWEGMLPEHTLTHTHTAQIKVIFEPSFI